MTYAEASRLWTYALELMRNTLLEGGSVVLTNIGTLTPMARRPRKYRNPKTGESVGERSVSSLRIQTSQKLRDQLKDIR